MKFNSAKEMFKALQTNDLYNPILEKYIWIYNDDETSIVCANVSRELLGIEIPSIICEAIIDISEDLSPAAPGSRGQYCYI